MIFKTKFYTKGVPSSNLPVLHDINVNILIKIPN